MSFYDIIVFVGDNLAVTPEILIMILFIVPALLFFAADFKVGLISSIIITSGLFIWFYQFNLQYDRVIILLLLLVVILAFTLYFISEKSQRSSAFI